MLKRSGRTELSSPSTRNSREVGLPSISNNVDPIKHFLSRLVSSLPRVVLLGAFDFRIDDHGSLVISRSASVRPNHLFDRYFDHDYFFGLPFEGAGCPIMWAVFYFPPWTVPSCPAYEPRLPDCEYSQPFRHIQYNWIAIRRPIATLAMLLCRRIAR